VIRGDSLNTIARRLNALGVRPTSGQQWWARSLGVMIRNPTYMGWRADGDGRYVHKCEALVDAATFRLAGEALDSRPKRGPQVTGNRAMLASALYCPDCENSSPMYRIRVGAQSNRASYYRCSGRGAQRKGCGNMIRMDVADAAVNQITADTLDQPVMITSLERGHNYEPELAEVSYKIRQLALQDLPDDEFDSRLTTLRAVRDELAARPVVPDKVIRTSAGYTYAELWASVPVCDRGPWLASHGFRITASRASVALTGPLGGDGADITVSLRL
jgi:hypothetical protein